MPTLTLPAARRADMVAHAAEDLPYEACGVLAGRGSRVERVYRGRNKLQSPVRYQIDPQDLLRIHRDIDDRDLEVVGYYHSHPKTDAYPSPTDVRLAFDLPPDLEPQPFYVLVSMMDDQHPRVRAFTIRGGQVEEHPIELVE